MLVAAGPHPAASPARSLSLPGASRARFYNAGRLHGISVKTWTFAGRRKAPRAYLRGMRSGQLPPARASLDTSGRSPRMSLRRPLAAALLALRARPLRDERRREPAHPPVIAPAPVVPPLRALTPLHADYPEGAQGDADVVVALVINADGSVRKARAEVGDGGRSRRPQWRPRRSGASRRPRATGSRSRRPSKPRSSFHRTAASSARAAPGGYGRALSNACGLASPRRRRSAEVSVHGEQPALGVQSFSAGGGAAAAGRVRRSVPRRRRSPQGHAAGLGPAVPSMSAARRRATSAISST